MRRQTRSQFSRCPVDGVASLRTADDPLVGQAVVDRYVVEACDGDGAGEPVTRAADGC